MITMALRISILFSILGALSACGPGRPDLRSIQLNKEGNKMIQAQTYGPAMEKYLEALKFDPFAGALHLNLGLTFEGTQQAEKALQSYKEAEALALKEENAALVFMARFNQGQLLGKSQRVDEALMAYQGALDILPTSVETKTNIELLTAQKQGGGQGEGEDQNQDQQGDQPQDKDGQGDGDKEKKDQDKEGDDKEEKPKDVKQSPKYQPRPFQGKELSEGDVKKILGELKQQEERIRAEYNRKETKEQPREKDW